MNNLNMLNDWNGGKEYAGMGSAQSYLNHSSLSSAFCASACGTKDDPEKPKKSACGSACGAKGDPEKPKKSACGSACGADKK